MTAGHVTLHWSRIVLAGLIAFGLGQMLITVLIANVLRFHADRKSPTESERMTEHRKRGHSTFWSAYHARLENQPKSRMSPF